MLFIYSNDRHKELVLNVFDLLLSSMDVSPCAIDGFVAGHLIGSAFEERF